MSRKEKKVFYFQERLKKLSYKNKLIHLSTPATDHFKTKRIMTGRLWFGRRVASFLSHFFFFFFFSLLFIFFFIL